MYNVLKNGFHDMKNEQRNLAVSLRQNETMSIKQIAKKLSVSCGSVSRWVRNVSLTPQQLKVLKAQNPVYNHQLNGARTTKSKYEAIRKKYREEGRILLLKATGQIRDLLIAGAMLYWGEGHKKNNRCKVLFSNSDVSMHKLFIKFLQHGLSVEPKNIIIRLNFYDDMHSSKEIEQYWLTQLGFSDLQLRKSRINNLPSSSKDKRTSYCEWGTCRLEYNSSRTLQQIYGMIQVVGGVSESCLKSINAA